MNKKNLVLLLLALMTAVLLTGCISSKNKSKMFDTLRERGYIEVGDRSWEDFDEDLSVDQSPIPAVKHYYIYRTEDTEYQIDYVSVSDDDENTETYRANVRIRRDGEPEEYRHYLFKNRKIIWLFWKLEFAGEE